MPQYRQVELARLHIDRTYERKVSEHHRRKLVENWDEALVGTITVAERRNGKTTKLMVLDGQHRVAAAKALGITHLPAIVMEVGSISDEAMAFIGLNNYKAMRRIDLFRARLRAGHPDAVAIDEAVRSRGFVISDTTGGNRKDKLITTAVSALELLHKHGALDRGLDLLIAAFGKKPGSIGAYPLRAITSLLGRHPDADDERLLGAMRRKPLASWVRDAREATSAYGGYTARHITNLWIGTYNKGLHGKQRLAPLAKGEHIPIEYPDGRPHPRSRGAS